jgi:hypothetical protein
MKRSHACLISIASLLSVSVTRAQTNNPPLVLTVAGSGPPKGVPATSTGIGGGDSIAADQIGNLYIADSENHLVYKVDTNGNIAVIAGTGASSGFVGNPWLKGVFISPPVLLTRLFISNGPRSSSGVGDRLPKWPTVNDTNNFGEL